MGYESQGDFMGDDLDADVDYLIAEAEAALKHKEITQKEFDRRMKRIDALDEMERERDEGPIRWPIG